jgi:tRNA A37 threonylcarbamoyladenosine synthetase subunit TsaC/SUA5/YrdC
VTSANLSGEPETTDAEGVRRQLGEAVDLILDGGPARGGTPSTIVDCSGAEPRILREGAIATAEIERALGSGPAGAGFVGR